MVCNECLDYCLVGEFFSIEVVGDVVKNGCCGLLICNLIIYGVQGYVVYLYFVDNFVYCVVLMLVELVNIEWDKGNEFFLLISMQIVNVQFGIGSNNVIFGDMFVQFNFCFSMELMDEMIKFWVIVLLEKYQLCYSVEWWFFGQLFFIGWGKLVDVVVNVIEYYNEIKLQLLINGGILDGWFIVCMGVQVVELGFVNVMIYKINECVNVVDLQLLVWMY